MSRLADDEFIAIRDYLAAEAGLAFDESRRAALSAVIGDRVMATESAGVAEYLALLNSTSGADERQRLLDAVTVQETRFFRNPPQIEGLRQRVLPELLRRTVGRTRPLTIWSAGCSTGEEPYTLAMMLLELSPVLARPGNVRILGTDVSAEALRAAARATYTGRSLDLMPPTVGDRWLEPRPGGALGVRDQVRRLVDLRLHNLVTEPAPFEPGEVDLVVCRNVTIYFDRPTTSRLIGGFHDVLAEGGYLLLGHSETLWQVSDAFSLMPVGDAFVYRRADGAAPSAARRARSRPTAAAPAAAARRAPAAQRPQSAATTAPAASVPVASVPVGSESTAPGGELLADAKVAFADGQYDVAARVARRAIDAAPLLTEAYLVLGQSRTSVGDDDAAVDPLRKAVYLDPAHAPAHFMLASVLARLRQHGASAVSYRAAARALELAPVGGHTAFLGGRDPRELASLCRRLATEQAGRDATPASSRGSS